MDEAVLRRSLEPRSNAPRLVEALQTLDISKYEALILLNDTQMLPVSNKDLCTAFDLPAPLASLPRVHILERIVAKENH